jgi:hypothetical protein
MESKIAGEKDKLATIARPAFAPPGFLPTEVNAPSNGTLSGTQWLKQGV